MFAGVLQRSRVLLAVALVLAPRLALAGREEIPELLKQLVNGSIGESNRAANRLNYLGPEVTGPYLTQLLASDDPQDRLAASSALVVVHYKGARSSLEDVLAHDEDWEVRRNAVNALAGIRADHAVRLIDQTLRKDPQFRVRKACVKALAELSGGAGALAWAAVNETDTETRLTALDGLSHKMDRSVAPTLRPLLEDASGLVRFATARALGWQGDEAARRFLSQAIESKDSERLRRGVTALSDVPRNWAVDLLVKAMDSTDDRAACEAAAALARRDDPRGAKQLFKISAGGGPQADRAQQYIESLKVKAP